MVGRKFRRSESFPAPKPSGGRTAAAKSSFRARCISLPSRTHPLAAHLADDLHHLLSWTSSSSPSPDARCISDGLARLHLLLAGLPDVLQLPHAQDPLRRSRHRSPALADRLLDDFLRLADAHGSFRSALLALKQHLAAAQVALRRRDEPRLASCLRAQRRAGKDLTELSSAVRETRRRAQPAGFAAGTAATTEEAEVARVMWEVAVSVAEASETVFLGVAEISAAATASAADATSSRFPWAAAVLRWRARATSKSLKKKASPENGGEMLSEEKEVEKWRKAALEKLGAAEDAIGSLEIGGELVFRSLVNVRVTLLNLLTPAF
ncbi:hypothetical protein Cni_G18490 [Canna indica]|uniref:Uncharacterized protein n=1 Tax=Canna indica TaxID=4628 RepID=A0AAQ3KPF1_9LILI|nr:hypothetical protein Cni_G18490 [Canna indica]